MMMSGYQRRSKALKKIGQLLYAVGKQLKLWKPWSTDERIDLGIVKLVEHVDLRVAKYILSLKPGEFKTLYFERAKQKELERSKRKKDASTKVVNEKVVDQLVLTDRKIIRELCTDFIKGQGFIERTYLFKAPKTVGRRFTRGLQGIWGAFKCALAEGLYTDFDTYQRAFPYPSRHVPSHMS